MNITYSDAPMHIVMHTYRAEDLSKTEVQFPLVFSVGRFYCNSLFHEMFLKEYICKLLPDVLAV